MQCILSGADLSPVVADDLVGRMQQWRQFAFGVVCWLGLAAAARADLVDDLVLNHIEALGGREALSHMSSLRAIGHSEFVGQRMRFVMWAERPNRIRIESIDATRTQTQAWDGEAPPWRQTRGPTGRSAPEIMTPAEAEQFTGDADFDDPLVDVTLRGGSMDYAGPGVVDGRPTQRILVTRDLVRQVIVHVDSESFLIVQLERTKAPGTPRETQLITRFHDYRPVMEVMLPHRIELTQGGKPWVSTTLEQIDGNPLIPPDFFSRPR